MLLTVHTVTVCTIARSLCHSTSRDALPHCIHLPLTVELYVRVLCVVLVNLILQKKVIFLLNKGNHLKTGSWWYKKTKKGTDTKTGIFGHCKIPSINVVVG